MGFEVYTTIPAPFRLGTNVDYIKTEIEEYQRVDIGSGYFGILFQNLITKSWHMGLEDCGALVGTNKSRAKLIATVKKDVSGGYLNQRLKWVNNKCSEPVSWNKMNGSGDSGNKKRNES